jgi:ankyrin repeat protein
VKINLDESLTFISRQDPTFLPEIRKLLAPVKDRFFELSPLLPSENPNDGLHTAPRFMTEPEIRKVAIELAELALSHGLDVNVPVEDDGSTFLHGCVLLRDSRIAVEAIEWLLSHGADPHRQRDNGETPLDIAEKFGRTEVLNVMRGNDRK